MNAVGGVIYTLICVGALSGFVLTAVPDGRHKKYISLITALIFIALLIAPLRTLASFGAAPPDIGASDSGDFEQEYERSRMESACAIAEDAIGDCIADKYGVERQNIAVKVLCAENDGEYKPQSVRISVKGDFNESERGDMTLYALTLCTAQTEVIFE